MSAPDAPLVLATLFAAGMVAGILLAWIFRSSRRKPKKRNTLAEIAAGGNGAAGKDDLPEQKVFELELSLRTARKENDDLRRLLAEAEELAKIRYQEILPGQMPASEDKPAEILYFLQPGSDGRFKEAGKVAQASEAVYELQIIPDRPAEASFRFIDTPANVSLAIQNEPTWILSACEKNNLLQHATSSIRTDMPGKVIRKDGDWEIVQKARITYA